MRFRPVLEALEDRQLLTLATPTLIAPLDSASPLPSFTWSPVDGATYYNFHLYNASTNVVTNGPNLTVTTLTLGAPLVPGDTYQWTVQAMDSVGNLGPWATTDTFGVTNLTAPTPIGPSGAALPTPTFTWSALTGAARYDIWVQNQSTNQIIRNTNVPNATWTPDTALPQGYTYKWWVRGIDGNGVPGPWSSAMAFSEAVLPAPVLIGPSGSAPTQPIFSWNIVAGADHYDIWIQDNATNQVIRNTSVGGTSWITTSPLMSQHNYTWWVRAIDPNGYAGIWSPGFTITVFALPAPTLTSPSVTATTLPTFSWAAVTGADHYDIWVQDMRTGVILRNINVAATTWKPDGALTQGDTYNWWVRAVDANGQPGVWSSSLAFTVPAMAAPTLVAPTGSSTLLPTFTWNTVAGADHYDVWLQDAKGVVTRNQNVTGTSWTPPGSLMSGAAYTWWVRAVDSNGSPGPWSVPLSFTAFALPAPTLVAPTGTSTTLPSFSWNAVAGADHYYIWLQDIHTGAVLQNMNVAGTTWTPGSALLQADTYQWWVQAINSAGRTSPWSSSQSFTVASLAAPALVSPVESSGLLPTFTWNAVTGADHYDIWLQDAKGSVLRNQNVAGTSWTPANPLTSGGIYTWWARAIDSVGSPGPWSSSLSFTAYVLAAPTLIGPTGASGTLPTFSWNSVTGADHYDIWVDDVSKNQFAVLRNQTVTATSWSPATPLIAGDKYRWWVRAITSSGGAGAWSSEFDFTVPKPT